MADPAEPNRSVHEDEPPSPSDVVADVECVDWCPICRTADVVRATAPPELRDQWQAVQREALLTARALIDSYLERIEEADREREPRIEEIPIE
jgi:hypothetical protein